MCMKITINSLMYNQLRLINTVELPVELKSIIKAGVCEKNGCIVLATLSKACQHAKLADFVDYTGYECFINHLHIDDYVNENIFLTALCFMSEVSDLVKYKFPDRLFRFIIARENDSSCNVRFHRLRDGEVWLVEDINQYHEEGILVMDG